MALGILFGVVAALMIAAYVTDLIRDTNAMSSKTQSKLLWERWTHSFRQSNPLEDTLRKVIREELKHTG